MAIGVETGTRTGIRAGMVKETTTGVEGGNGTGTLMGTGKATRMGIQAEIGIGTMELNHIPNFTTSKYAFLPAKWERVS